MHHHRIMFVDDEKNVLSALSRALQDEPYEIITANGANEALRMLETTRCTVVVSDEQMPGMDGVALLGLVRKYYPTTIRMMLTGHASIELTMQAVNNGEIYRFFTKPWDDTALILAIRSAVEKFDLEEENRRLLKTVRRQSQEIKVLESLYPGISEVQRDATGAMELPEISDEEIMALIESCNRITP